MAAEYISQNDFGDTDSLNKRCIREVYLIINSQVGKGKSAAIETALQK